LKFEFLQEKNRRIDMRKSTLLAIIALPLLINTFSFSYANASNTIEFLNSKPASEKLPFSEIVRVENTLYISGKIGINPITKTLVTTNFKAEASQTLTNIKQTLEAHGYSMKQIVKCTVMLTDINNFSAFNEVYTNYFSPPYPARSAFAVKELALNSHVEVECIASVVK
jgi:reactive intermediate/imine deaminase